MFSKKGYQVDSLELVQHNLDILKSKITSDMNIKAIQSNALDMSIYNDNTFDVVLCLGPLYHLENENRKNYARFQYCQIKSCIFRWCN